MAKQISTEIDHRIAMHYDAEKDICYPISYETQAIDVMFEDGTDLETTIKNLKEHGDDVKIRSAAALSSIGVKTNSDADWDEVIEHIYDSATVNYNKGYEDAAIIYLGTGTSFDVSSISGYRNLTKDNFVMQIGSISVAPYANVNGNFAGTNGAKPELKYDATTGVVSVTGTTIIASTRFGFNAAYPYGHGYSDHSANGGATVTITPKVYLAKGFVQKQ